MGQMQCTIYNRSKHALHYTVFILSFSIFSPIVLGILALSYRTILLILIHFQKLGTAWGVFISRPPFQTICTTFSLFVVKVPLVLSLACSNWDANCQRDICCSIKQPGQNVFRLHYRMAGVSGVGCPRPLAIGSSSWQ